MTIYNNKLNDVPNEAKQLLNDNKYYDLLNIA